MGIFGRSTSERRVDDLERTVRQLDDRMGQLITALADLQLKYGDLERPVREMQVEWDDTFEKYRNLYGRITKRIKRAAAEEEEPEPKGGGQLDLQPGGLPADINPLAERLLSRGRG